MLQYEQAEVICEYSTKGRYLMETNTDTEHPSFKIETSDRPQPETPKENPIEAAPGDNVSNDVSKEETTLTLEETKEEGTKEGDKPKPKKKSRKQERIESQARTNRAQANKIKELEEELRLKDAPIEPNIDDFEQYEDFEEAENAYKKESKVFEESAKPEAKVDAELEDARISLEVKFDDAREVYDDFDTVIKKLPENGGATITREMVLALNEIENSGEVAYALGKDVIESLRIANLSPMKQIIEISKLSDKLKDTHKPVIETIGKKQTDAQEPINPISRAGGSVKRGLGEAVSFKDYSSMRTEQQSSRGGW